MIILYGILFTISQKSVLSRIGRDISQREPAMYDVKRFNIPIYAEESGLTWDDYVPMDKRTKLWPNGRIRYALHGDFSNDFKANLKDNIFYFHHSTCIRFEEVDYDVNPTIDNSSETIPYSSARRLKSSSAKRRRSKSFVPADLDIMTSTRKCKATVGFHGTNSRIEVNEALCNKFTDLSHLLMHVLGFDHEFVRKDRDTYITLREHNIDPEYRHLFDKDEHFNTYIHVPYNPYSVLHPTSYDMGKNTGDLVFNWWFTDIEGGIIRNRNTLHIYDMMNVNLLYRCGRSNAQCRDELSPGLCSNLGKGDESGPLVDGIVMFVEKAKCWNDTFAREECPRTCGHCYMYDVEKPWGNVKIDKFFNAHETSRLTGIYKAMGYMETISDENSKKRRGVLHKSDWWE